MNNFETRIRVTSHEFEGFFYIEANGEFFKGCQRCGGTGHFSHNGHDSICYLCNNVTEARLGDHLDSEAAAQKWCHERAVRRNQRIRKAEAKRQIEVKALADKVAALPEDVRSFLLAIELDGAEYDAEGNMTGYNYNGTEKSAFVRSMAEQVQFVSEARRPFTEKMIESVRKVIADRSAKAEHAASHPAPSGRVAVTGTITGTKIIENDFGTAYKITVLDDKGFRVYVSIPRAQADIARDDFIDRITEAGSSIYDFGSGCWFVGTERYEGVKGRRITFTATLEASSDDASFAFGSRPTKGAWL